MPPHARVNGSDSQAAGRGRQRLKLAGLAYYNVRHGIDADVESTLAARMFLRKMAIEFVGSLAGNYLKNRRLDLYTQGDDEMLVLAAIAYASSRHGIDADVGMSREGLAMLCQASIDFVESLPKDDQSKRPATDPHLQIGNGVPG
jgi:hypothetical protein